MKKIYISNRDREQMNDCIGVIANEPDFMSEDDVKRAIDDLCHFISYTDGGAISFLIDMGVMDTIEKAEETDTDSILVRLYDLKDRIRRIN